MLYNFFIRGRRELRNKKSNVFEIIQDQFGDKFLRFSLCSFGFSLAHSNDCESQMKLCCDFINRSSQFKSID